MAVLFTLTSFFLLSESGSFSEKVKYYYGSTLASNSQIRAWKKPFKSAFDFSLKITELYSF